MQFKSVTQKEIIDADCSARIVVNAGPGTGKTYTLIERVKRLLKDDNIDASSISILCFSRAAVRVVRERLEYASEHGEISRKWLEIDLRSLDSFATYLLLWGRSENIVVGDISRWDYDERIHQAVLLLNKYGVEREIMAPYQHVFIDEIQDLVNDRVDFVIALLKNVISLNDACGFTLFGDLCQAIYDYSAEQNKASVDLYNRLFALQNFDFSTTYLFYELNENHRQSAELQNSLKPFRDCLLKNDYIKCETAQKKILSIFPSQRIDFSNFSISSSGTVGILTRTNAEAIVISEWLKRGKTPHRLYCHTTKKFALGDWVGRIILSCNDDMISQEQFQNLFNKIYPELHGVGSEKYWKSLIGETESTNEQYKLSSILSGIIGKSKDLCLMDCIESADKPVSVSCIHQSKGLEYDTVVVLDNIFSDEEKELAYDGCEHKVHYVALTRPKSKLICTHIARQYIHVVKNESRRCFKVANTKDQKHKFLSRIEVGESADINELSLALNRESQDYICNTLKAGDGLVLKRCDIGSLSLNEKRVLGSDQNGYEYCYRISPTTNESITLGYTSRKFNDIIIAALRQMWRLPYHVTIKKEQLPIYLRDVQVENIVTYVASNSVILPSAKKIGNSQIWQGFSMSGFARTSLQ
ncbi:UvrD-helicase domain-containing protein [Fibrobacter sp. UWB7]|uniref:UvrD-helicase domain-containing protein n=1 Tax=Fibrobacter sp. UWB7 TaxID=1896206 RepID=UPI000919C39E|nr:UvrD-helicase domain-containing protein [Fibrobacter sp. UWB7]SHM17372.1 UvrD/REP helicase N-terminal domain-containing protein [Fibrobacter sp. UWB7]